jgi:hypothetical protein
MEIITTEGERLSGDPREIITQLRRTSRMEADLSNFEFRLAMARRAKQWNGSVVRTDDDRHFLEDLEKAGLIEITASVCD